MWCRDPIQGDKANALTLYYLSAHSYNLKKERGSFGESFLMLSSVTRCVTEMLNTFKNYYLR